MLVQQILKSKAGSGESVTITPEQTVQEAARLMAERRIGAVMVTDSGGQVVGVLSERDIVRELGRQGSDCLARTVGQVMTREVAGCTPEDPADHILARMTGGRFRHMPVIQDGRMIGVISIGDVVKARLDELSMEHDALKGMIMGY